MIFLFKQLIVGRISVLPFNLRVLNTCTLIFLNLVNFWGFCQVLSLQNVKIVSVKSHSFVEMLQSQGDDVLPRGRETPRHNT